MSDARGAPADVAARSGVPHSPHPVVETADSPPIDLTEAIRDLRDCTKTVIDNGQLLSAYVTAALSASRASSQQLTGHAIAELVASREACTAAATSLRQGASNLGANVESANAWVRTMGSRLESAERAMASARVALETMARSTAQATERRDRALMLELRSDVKRLRRIALVSTGLCALALVVSLIALTMAGGGVELPLVSGERQSQRPATRASTRGPASRVAQPARRAGLAKTK
jgi:hypothetical protein